MPQSSVIFAYLLIAYLIFIGLRGELPDYILLLRGGGQQPAAGGAGSSATSSGASSLIDQANNLYGIPTLIQIPGGSNSGSSTGSGGGLNTDWLTQLVPD